MGKGIVKLGEGNWAVKDGNLLAAKETNGRFKNAEFTVTRGTRATYVGKDGLIKESNLQDVNLIANGTFDTDSDWNGVGSSGWSISNGKARRSGYSVNSDIRQVVPVVNGGLYKFSYTRSYESGNGQTNLYIQLDNANYSTLGNYTSTVVEEHTVEGYFTTTFTGNLSFRIFGINNFTGTIDNVSVQEVKTDTPRIDFTDNTDGHLLLEPESTNLVLYSENFNETETHWSFAFNGTGSDPVETKENISSPDGSLGVSKIVFNGGEGTTSSDWSFITQSYTSSANDFTISIYLKGKNGGEKIFVDCNNGNDNIVTLTTSWQRYDITRTHTSTSGRSIRIGLRGGTGSDMGETTVYAWGAQHEQLSYPTSYIPTNGGQVTRDAETCTGAGEAIDFNSEEGVLYAEIATLSEDNNVAFKSLSIAFNSTNKVMITTQSTSLTSVNIRRSDDASNKFVNILTPSESVNFNKIAILYKSGENKIFVNGSRITDTAFDTFTFDYVGNSKSFNKLEFANGSGASNFQGKCKAIRVYKEALSDSELTTLTS